MTFLSSLGNLFYKFSGTGTELDEQRAGALVLINPKTGKAISAFGGTEPQILADGITLLGAASSTPVANVPGGEYILDITWTGSASGIRIDSLAADGVTWRQGPIIQAVDTDPIEIKIGGDATVRLTNVDATNAADEVFARIS